MDQHISTSFHRSSRFSMNVSPYTWLYWDLGSVQYGPLFSLVEHRFEPLTAHATRRTAMLRLRSRSTGPSHINANGTCRCPHARNPEPSWGGRVLWIGRFCGSPPHLPQTRPVPGIGRPRNGQGWCRSIDRQSYGSLMECLGTVVSECFRWGRKVSIILEAIRDDPVCP